MDNQIVKALCTRTYLSLLQGMFSILYGAHLMHISPTNLQVVMMVTLAAFTLMLLAVPRTQLDGPSFVGALTLANAAILFGTISEEAKTDPKMIGEIVLLFAMASYIPSIPNFAMVSGLLVTGYGFSLHQSDLLQTDIALLLPSLLCLTLVFFSKLGIFQAEIHRLQDEQSRRTSNKDPLTGLPNRAQFLEQVRRIIQYRYINRDFDFAVLFIDLDGFKPINDKLGHKAGDTVLRNTAKVLQGCVRKGDFVGRYGGDEFTVLLNHITSQADAARVAQGILSKIQTPIHVGESVAVGASIGIAMSTNLHVGAEDLIRDADAAMYQAKAQGKNSYVFSDQSEIPKAELKERWKQVSQKNWLGRGR